MGYRCAWIAARGLPLPDVLAALRLTRTGEVTAPVHDPGLYAVTLANGWSVVLADGARYMTRLRDEHAVRLSRRAETLFFLTDDTPMASYLGAFADGACTWEVSYDGSKGVAAPELLGPVPAAVRSRLAEADRAQAAAGGEDAPVDHRYDVTAAAARDLIGFRHDETLPRGEALPVQQLALAR